MRHQADPVLLRELLHIGRDNAAGRQVELKIKNAFSHKPFLAVFFNKLGLTLMVLGFVLAFAQSFLSVLVSTSHRPSLSTDDLSTKV